MRAGGDEGLLVIWLELLGRRLQIGSFLGSRTEAAGPPGKAGVLRNSVGAIAKVSLGRVAKL